MLIRSPHVTLLLALTIGLVESSHFLGGTINWRIQNSSTNSSLIGVLITQTYSFTYVVGKCSNSAIANNQPVSGSGGPITCLPSCPTGFGSLSSVPQCTDASLFNGIAVGQRSDVVYIPIGSVFSMIYASSAWGTLTLGGVAWSITSRINLVRRSDNNMFNNAPVATVMSPVNIVVNQKTWIPISVSDADGDTIRCRWAALVNGVDECSSICPPAALPANTIIYPNCTVEITGPAISNKYAIALTVEDFTDPSSTTPLSSVPVQFIVNVIAPPSCLLPPDITLAGQACTPVAVNQVFQSSVLTTNQCGGNVTIVDIATLSFPGMVQGPLTQINSLVYYKTLTWTPTINQLGYQVMCAMAINSQYSQSPQQCFTFYVTINGTGSCPGIVINATIVLPPTTTTTESTTTTTTTTESTTTTTTTTESTTTTTTTTESTTTTTATTTTSMTNSPPTASCINWPLIAGLAALAFAALACNLCLLCRLFHCCSGTRWRRAYQRGPSESSPSVVRTSKINPIYTLPHEDLNRSDNHLTEPKHAKIADGRKQPKIVKVSPLSQTRPPRTNTDESNAGDQPPDHNHPSSTVHSKTLIPKADRNNVHITKVPSVWPRVEPDQILPKMKRTHKIASVCRIPTEGNSLAVATDASDSHTRQAEHHQKSNTNSGVSLSKNITVGYVSKPHS